CLAGMETYSEEARHAFEKTLGWLGQWACSRSFGLGSRLPWDKQFLIESLSDSTIYNAYYTVAHLLHGGNLDGSKPGEAGILPEQMTDEVWDYVLRGDDLPKETTIPVPILERLRREFEYFYPIDLRVSGKDLITNHLTFLIYNHVAIFPKKHWPKSIRANGHLLLNGEKMAKSTGNMMTIRDAIEQFGADATRFTLADAGDALEDANFVAKTADGAILKLYTEKEWIEEALAEAEAGKLRTGAYTWNDRVFEAEIVKFAAEADKAYAAMLYREAVKVGYYELQNARNEYRKATTPPASAAEGEVYEGMHKDLVMKYVEVQTLLLAPITPHWSENIWTELLKKPQSVMHARWPVLTPPADSASLLAAAEYVRGLGARIRSAEDQASKKKAKKGAAAEADESGPRTLRLYVASTFPAWQDEALAVLKETWDEATKKLSGNEKQLLAKKGLMKNKAVMPFIMTIKNCAKMLKLTLPSPAARPKQQNVEAIGGAAFDRKLPFNEAETLASNLDFVRRELAMFRIAKVEVVNKENVAAEDVEDFKKADAAVPGQPAYRIL
ncbi:hypothetical protein BDK51DRAFT_27993, partial [Blyttiomyces helicus]